MSAATTVIRALRRAWARDLDAPTLYGLLALRVEVFVVEQSCPYPELDGRDLDTQTRHFWLEKPGGEVISVLRLLEDHARLKVGGEQGARCSCMPPVPGRHQSVTAAT
jgi:ElaA protein